MEQLILLVKYQTKPNKRKDFVKKVISSGVLEKIRQEDGYISYDYYYDAVNPDCVPVSYTHLDVYKRQFVAWTNESLSWSRCFS